MAFGRLVGGSSSVRGRTVRCLLFLYILDQLVQYVIENGHYIPPLGLELLTTDGHLHNIFYTLHSGIDYFT